MPFELTGVDSMKRELDKVLKGLEDHALTALNIEGEAIMAKSKESHVPVDLGNLKSTGTVEPPTRKGKVLRIRLRYGGTSAPYALAIHEHLSKYSPPSWKAARIINWRKAGTGPKYLEIPLRASVSGMGQRIAAHIRARLN